MSTTETWGQGGLNYQGTKYKSLAIKKVWLGGTQILPTAVLEFCFSLYLPLKSITPALCGQ